MLLKSLIEIFSKKSCSAFFNRPVYSLIAAVFLTTGCTMVGPDFVKPQAPVAAQWMESAKSEIKTEASEYRQWWAVFNDPGCCRQSLSPAATGQRRCQIFKHQR
jgi:hypothetical protein